MAAAAMFFVCVMDVESGCGLPWRMWMECVAMCVDGCVERVCPRELCGVRFEVRGVHASGLSSMCPSVYAMLWSVLLWAWFLPLYGGARVGRLYVVWKVDCSGSTLRFSSFFLFVWTKPFPEKKAACVARSESSQKSGQTPSQTRRSSVHTRGGSDDATFASR